MVTLIVPPLDLSFPTLGPDLKSFIEDRCVFGPGSLAGRPAVLDDEKVAALYRLYEVNPQGHRLAGRRRFQRGALEWAKGLAKALALDTPIPTPSGWTTMGQLSVGDVVFDEAGKRARVVAASEVFYGHDCYRVTFSDGTSIVADAGHRWYTEELRHSRRLPSGKRKTHLGSVKTTAELCATVHASGALNHRIPVAGALDIDAGDLSVDPWVLGMWLGDGRTDDAEFSMHARDFPSFEENVGRAGYFLAAPKVDSRSGVYAVRVSTSPITRGGAPRDTLKGRLRELGVLGNKHVPSAYMRGSFEQRLSLIQGLMDSDGTISKDGSNSSFTTTLRGIADQVLELLRSVGLKPTMHSTKSRGASAWKVSVFADANMPLFRLPRKRDRQREPVDRVAMSSNRHIVSVDRVDSVPTRCIGVDSRSHLFLAGESMVPTHNTEFAAWVMFCELHPESPVRCDGFDANGNPVGRPVNFPYIPMMAHTQEQVSELAYGVLKYVVEEGPDADLFDASLDRILRKGPTGRADGKAVPVANAPGSRDGALTTCQHFDEPHRLNLPSHRNAHETMAQNIHKRTLEDPWAFYTSTAGQPGQNSIEEDVRGEAEDIAAGKVEDPALFFFARWAGPEHDDMSTLEKRMAAVAEARGPAGEYGPGQIERIAKDYDRKGVDKAYWERTQLNRWRKSNSMAFDLKKIEGLCLSGEVIPPGAFITLGFDGARFRDATGFVATDMATGMQQLLGGWERPEEVDEWEVDEAEVTATLEHVIDTYDVWKMYGDPPHWTETMGSWSVRWPDLIEEWWTARPKVMAYTLREYVELIDSASISFGGTEEQHDDLIRHIGNAGRKDLKILDDEGKPLWILQKQDGRQDLKFDFAMASVLSAKCRLDAIKDGAKPRKAEVYAPRRIY